MEANRRVSMKSGEKYSGLYCTTLIHNNNLLEDLSSLSNTLYYTLYYTLLNDSENINYGRFPFKGVCVCLRKGKCLRIKILDLGLNNTNRLDHN